MDKMEDLQRPLKDEQLREWFQEHFVYSIKLLTQTAALAATCKYDPNVHPEYLDNTSEHIEFVTLNNALYQTFLIEFRNLIDFFYDPINYTGKFPYDARALDYFKTQAEIDAWKSARPEKTPALAEVWELIGSRVVHLSFKRSISPNHKRKYRWMALNMWMAIYEINVAFLSVGLPSRTGDKTALAEYLDDARRDFSHYPIQAGDYIEPERN